MIVNHFIVVVSFALCLTLTWSEGYRVRTRWSSNAPYAAEQPKSLDRFIRAIRNRRASVITSHEFNSQERNAAVDAHNEARRIAQPTATGMLKMFWDDDLAARALSSAELCLFKHNSDRSDGFSYYVGENIFVSYGSSFDENYIRNAINAWDEEKEYFNYDANSCPSNQQCGHYTQVVWDSSYKVGCAATLCNSISVGNSIWNEATLFFCNYGPGGNIVGVKPFVEGPSCSACPASFSYCDDKLCTYEDTSIPTSATGWGAWGLWSSCNATCGGGSRTRTRECQSSSCPQETASPGESMSEECNTNTCSQGWGDWGPWSSCSASCDSGYNWRTRWCLSELCANDETGWYEYGDCNETPCVSATSTSTTTTSSSSITTTAAEGTSENCCIVGDSSWSNWSNWACGDGSCLTRSKYEKKCQFGWCYTYTTNMYTGCGTSNC